MAMVSCNDCSFQYSSRRHKDCPKCSPVAEKAVDPEAISWPLVFTVIALFSLSTYLVTKTFLGFIESAYADAPEREAIELCRLTAHLHASEMGSSMYKYAQADTPDNAILHFRHPKSGRTWTSNYVCS